MQRNKNKKIRKSVCQTSSLDLPIESGVTDSSPFFFSEQLMNRIVAGTCRKGTGVAWTSIEKELYVQFLKDHEDLFEFSEKQRQLAGIHRMMSNRIKTKNPNQCRSHHQKMMIRYKTVQTIIKKCQPKVLNPPPEETRVQGRTILNSRWSRELIDCSELEQEDQEVSLWHRAMRQSEENHYDPLMN